MTDANVDHEAALDAAIAAELRAGWSLESKDFPFATLVRTKEAARRLTVPRVLSVVFAVFPKATRMDTVRRTLRVREDGTVEGHSPAGHAISAADRGLDRFENWAQERKRARDQRTKSH